MTNDISIKFQVDDNLLDKVEQESYEILLQQRLNFNNRYYSSPIYGISMSLLRMVGLILCFLGILLCVFYLVYPSACPKGFFAEIYLSIFIAGTIIFWFLPRIEEKIKSKLKNAGSGSCKRIARRMVAKARKHVPYTAEYVVKGDLVSYYRGKGNRWNQVWSRRLKGFAIVDKHSLLFFRKPTSYAPVMLLLSENSDEMLSVLKNTLVTYEIKT